MVSPSFQKEVIIFKHSQKRVPAGIDLGKCAEIVLAQKEG